MNLLNKHYTTISNDRCATKYNIFSDMVSARTWNQKFNKEYISRTMQVCKKDPCTLKCGDMASGHGVVQALAHGAQV